MTMSTKKRILAGLLGGRVDQVPVWLPVVGVTVPMMEKSKTPWPQSHKDPEQMARLAAMPWELARLPAVTVPFCLSLEAEALGCQLDWGTISRTPSVKKRACGKPDELEIPDNLLEHGRIPVALKAIDILSKRIGDEVPINAKVTGGFTIAGHVFGVSDFISWIKTDPEYVREAVERAGEVTKELITAFEAHGADIISISDPTSSGDLLSGEQYREFVLPHHQAISQVARKPTVLHICGNTTELLPYLRTTGFDAYSFEEKIDVLTAKKALGDDISLVGNVAPVGTMLQGTPEKVTADALKAMRDGIDVLSSGCTLSPLTPLENIRALAKAPGHYSVPKKPEELLREFSRGFAEGAEL
jgi:methylthiol:coenzyme M methyltransferase